MVLIKFETFNSKTVFKIQTSMNKIINTIALLLVFIVLLVAGYMFYFGNPVKLISSPKINYSVSNFDENFIDRIVKPCSWTGYKRKLRDAIDYENSIVRNFNVRLVSNSEGEFNLGQVCYIFDHYYNNWKYVDDPTGTEYVSLASETISNNFSGDCDDFAVLMAASIISIGGEARVSLGFDEKSGHAFTEVNLGKTDLDLVVNYLSLRYIGSTGINYRQDEFGNNWLNLDWFGNHPGGEYFNSDNESMYYVLQNYCQDYSK
jgi:hypothetical protein